NNRAGISGAAVDVFSSGSWASFENCLFVRNTSNEQMALPRDPAFSALTVFEKCRVTVQNCTFVGNRNGVDDRGTGSTYVNSIYWNNNFAGGKHAGRQYELFIQDPAGVQGCVIHGDLNDVLDNVDTKRNKFDAPDPQFDEGYVPQQKDYRTLGY